jgi:prepilin peptidase CpaA
LQTTILLLGVTLFALAAYRDVKTLKIPNLLAAAIAALGLFRLIVIGDPHAALYTVGAGLAVLLATFLLFWRGVLGGGDAKLMAATALLVGYHDLFRFLALMSVFGLLVTLAVLATARRPEPDSLAKRPLAVPYGVAIAGGALVTLLFQPPLLG